MSLASRGNRQTGTRFWGQKTLSIGHASLHFYIMNTHMHGCALLQCLVVNTSQEARKVMGQLSKGTLTFGEKTHVTNLYKAHRNYARAAHIQYL